MQVVEVVVILRVDDNIFIVGILGLEFWIVVAIEFLWVEVLAGGAEREAQRM